MVDIILWGCFPSLVKTSGYQIHVRFTPQDRTSPAEQVTEWVQLSELLGSPLDFLSFPLTGTVSLLSSFCGATHRLGLWYSLLHSFDIAFCLPADEDYQGILEQEVTLKSTYLQLPYFTDGGNEATRLRHARVLTAGEKNAFCWEQSWCSFCDTPLPSLWTGASAEETSTSDATAIMSLETYRITLKMSNLAATQTSV